MGAGLYRRVAAGVFPILWFVYRKEYLKFKGHLFYAALIQAVASILVWAVMAAVARRILSGDVVAWIACWAPRSSC